MGIRRIAVNLPTATPAETAAFYTEVLGMQVVMDEAWIVTVADPHRTDRQISLLSTDATAPMNPVASIEVDDVDETYRGALEAGAEIVYPISDEEWGVRRFFLRDPAGNIVNVLAHRG